MITGIETAGLVLAAFPLMLQLFDVYKRGLQPIRAWWTFYLVLPQILNQMKIQEILYSRVLSKLLQRVIHSHEEVKVLCDNPSSQKWKSSNLDLALTHVLGLPCYQSFLGLINEMNVSMGKIKDILGVTRKKVNMTADKRYPPSFLRRVKISLKGRDIARLLGSFDKNRKLLNELLDCTTNSDKAFMSQTLQIGKSLSQIKASADCLFVALGHDWRCARTHKHTVYLGLEQRPLKGNNSDWQLPEDYLPTFSVFIDRRKDTTWIPRPKKHIEAGKGVISDSRPPQKKSRLFLKKQRIPSKATAQASKISSLCEALRKSQTTPAELGSFFDMSISVVQRFLNPSRIVPLSNCLKSDVTLSQETMGPEFLMPRNMRFEFAVTLASTMLQLHSTQWAFQCHLSKETIFLNLRGQKKSYINPIMIGLDKPDFVGSNDIADSFTKLGILLLELCFGETIESKYFRERYFGSYGEPNDQTDRMTAYKWWEEVYMEAGHHFSLAVRRCLDCNFGLSHLDLHRPECLQMIHDQVVEPLRKASSTWTIHQIGVSPS